MNRENKHLPSVNSRRDFLKVSSMFLASGILTQAQAKKIDIEKLFAFRKEIQSKDVKKLHLYSVNSKKLVDIEYYEHGAYISEGLEQIYKILADRRNGEIAAIDTDLIESIYKLQNKLNSSKPIEIISGYRSVASNTEMAKHNDGVAMNSYHTKGKAVDLALKGISTKEIHELATQIHVGGIGYYPESGFVHIDVGPVRNWRG